MNRPHTARRRKKQLSVCRVIFTLIVCILVLGCSVLLTDDSVDAHNDGESAAHKYYTSITVAPGDSLWSIAARYMDDNYESIHDYIDELREINDLDSNRIQAGQYLTISYYELCDDL